MWVESEDTCWLVAYDEYHATGDRKDVYNYFEKLQQRGELAPTEDDWLAVTESTPQDLLEKLRDLAPGLIAEARQSPGTEAMVTFQAQDSDDGGRGQAVMAIDVVVLEREGAEEGWIGVTLPRDTDWPQEGVLAIVAALVPPEIDSDALLPSSKLAGRDRHKGEIVFTWSRYF
ncbi:hypothetical protein [Kribbella sindirgiensis]|uniref:Uncharacterized protein n=1 Tax=Kribbella sindirgiensis TaxID=1124744 RepID=A0A4R0IRN8_9ACTN|nr:hypothetical protein [Kribbella sindirgiensis]TCC35074.1 hypothetical protein E0H50_14495 [Kribbella sindirgiensis]